MEADFRQRPFPRQAGVEHCNIAVSSPSPGAGRERQRIEAFRGRPEYLAREGLDRQLAQPVNQNRIMNQPVGPFRLDENPLAELIDHGNYLIGAACLDEFSRDSPVQELLTGEQP